MRYTMNKFGETVDSDRYLVTRLSNGHSFYVLFGLCGDEAEYGLKANWTWEDLNHSS